MQAHYGRRDIAQRLVPPPKATQVTAAAKRRARTERERTVVGIHEPFFYDG
jgi:hypothetical protein